MALSAKIQTAKPLSVPSELALSSFLAVATSLRPPQARMTAYHDAHSVEARKARYSRELAAYTLRQWDLVRQTMEEGATNPTDKSTSQLSQRDRSSSSATMDSETSSRSRSGASRMQADRTAELTRRRRAGIQARDYAQSAHRHINGGRAVTAGNA